MTLKFLLFGIVLLNFIALIFLFDLTAEHFTDSEKIAFSSSNLGKFRKDSLVKSENHQNALSTQALDEKKNFLKQLNLEIEEEENDVELIIEHEATLDHIDNDKSNNFDSLSSDLDINIIENVNDQDYAQNDSEESVNSAKGPIDWMKKYTDALILVGSNSKSEEIKKIDPFYLFDAYPKFNPHIFNAYPINSSMYGTPMYGLNQNSNYCPIVDLYNLANPENIFLRMNFFTDYSSYEPLPRDLVMKVIGNDANPDIVQTMPDFNSRDHQLNYSITTFFTKRYDVHIFHEIGNHFMCPTQMYGHIPGHGVLTRKDLVVDSIARYSERFSNRPKCFNEKMFFPFSYRFYEREECLKFFIEVNSEGYKERYKKESIQYLIKVGNSVHRAQGVFLLDEQKLQELKNEYGEHGEYCGIIKKSLLAQKYITNPLLLDFDNKFDFRMYLLVASTHPTIAYYHDGFLRVSLEKYDKFSTDRATHLTNTHLSKLKFSEAKNEKIHNMTEPELREYQMWSLQKLSEYLLKKGKISDPNWLETYLEPLFKKAFIHLIRVADYAFLKEPNVFELYGLDFMLDDNLNLWFIECNGSPQYVGTSPAKTEFLVKMLGDMFDIQYSLFRSRMKRIIKFFEDFSDSMLYEIKTESLERFRDINKNYLEPEYHISINNSFVEIVNKNLEGKNAFYNFIDEECLDNQD